MTEPIFDKKDQLNRVQQLLVEGEILYGVYDLKGGGTGFVGITDLRLVFIDESFVRKAKLVVSVPFTNVTAIGAEDKGKIMLGSLLGSSRLFVMSAGHTWEFEFRSNQKAHEAYGMMMRNLLQTEARGM